MSRATWVLAATTLGFAGTTAWLYAHPRETTITVTASAPRPAIASREADPWTSQARPTASVARSATVAPALPLR